MKYIWEMSGRYSVWGNLDVLLNTIQNTRERLLKSLFNVSVSEAHNTIL